MAAAPPGGAAAQPSAIAPALAGANNVIDYSTRAGQTLYAQATGKLPYIFQGKQSSLATFLQAVRDRSQTAGWDDIFTITIGQDNAGNDIDRNLITHYGEITLDNVRENAIQDYLGQPVRNAQVSHQIYQCLRNSISDDVSERLVTESNNFYINGIPDGPSFLMCIVRVYLVKTNATPTTLRLKISEAHKMIAEHEFNIDVFNNELNGYIQQLSANGEETHDLFAHLTKAYKTVPDKAFQSYIRTKIDTHNDGTSTLTTNQLMEYAKQKYDELIEDKSWMRKDNTEQQLIALTAQLQQIKIKANRKQNNQPPRSSTSSKNGNAKQKGKDKWAWKTIKPARNQEGVKRVNGHTYHWCKHHNSWTIHKPVDCRLNPKARRPKNAPQDSTNANPSATVGLSAILDEAPFHGK